MEKCMILNNGFKDSIEMTSVIENLNTLRHVQAVQTPENSQALERIKFMEWSWANNEAICSYCYTVVVIVFMELETLSAMFDRDNSLHFFSEFPYVFRQALFNSKKLMLLFLWVNISHYLQ